MSVAFAKGIAWSSAGEMPNESNRLDVMCVSTAAPATGAGKPLDGAGAEALVDAVGAGPLVDVDAPRPRPLR